MNHSTASSFHCCSWEVWNQMIFLRLRLPLSLEAVGSILYSQAFWLRPCALVRVCFHPLCWNLDGCFQSANSCPSVLGFFFELPGIHILVFKQTLKTSSITHIHNMHVSHASISTNISKSIPPTGPRCWWEAAGLLAFPGCCSMGNGGGNGHFAGEPHVAVSLVFLLQANLFSRKGTLQSPVY